MKKKWIAPLVLLGVSACAPKPDYRPNFTEPTRIAVQGEGPEGAPADTCWGRDETPATIETVSQTVQVTPEERAEDGRVVQSATYQSVQYQRIIEARDDIWFETPCPDQIDAAFVVGLERALSARGYFTGEPDAIVDAQTVAAIRAYQRTLKLNSGQLSLIAARTLGLVAYSREEIAKF